MLRPVITRADLLHAPRPELLRILREGHAIDPTKLDDYEYRGVSLGLPAFVERLTWKTFQKTFHRDPETGELRGWNVRLEQLGLDAESTPRRTKSGDPLTFGHYRAVALDAASRARGIHEGLLLDYGESGNPRMDASALVRDPIAAVNAGSVELLLGWTLIALGSGTLATPSFFALERERPLTHRVAPPRPRAGRAA